jgi:hypothetical protein
VVTVVDSDTITLVEDRLLCTIRTFGLRQPQCLKGVEPCHWHLATLGPKGVGRGDDSNYSIADGQSRRAYNAGSALSPVLGKA